MKAVHLIPLAGLLAVTSLATAVPRPAAPAAVAAQEPVTVIIEFDRTAQPANRSGADLIKVSLQPEQGRRERARAPMNPALAPDRSAPMRERRIAYANQPAAEGRRSEHRGYSNRNARFSDVRANARATAPQAPRRRCACAETGYTENQVYGRRAANCNAPQAGANNRTALVQRRALAPGNAGQNRQPGAMMREANRQEAQANAPYRNERMNRRARMLNPDAPQRDEGQPFNRQREGYRNDSPQSQREGYRNSSPQSVSQQSEQE